jgi:hypothetical protein
MMFVIFHVDIMSTRNTMFVTVFFFVLFFTFNEDIMSTFGLHVDLMFVDFHVDMMSPRNIMFIGDMMSTSNYNVDMRI